MVGSIDCPHRTQAIITELTALSTLARKALNMLAEGEEVRYASGVSLYTEREQFKARRKSASRRKVRGIGFATMDELRREGMIVPVHHTSVSTYYRLKPTP